MLRAIVGGGGVDGSGNFGEEEEGGKVKSWIAWAGRDLARVTMMIVCMKACMIDIAFVTLCMVYRSLELGGSGTSLQVGTVVSILF